MENKEQLVESLREVASVAEESVFSKEDYALFEKCGISAEDIKKLEQAEMMSDVVDVLPGDDAGVQKLAAALGAISNKDSKKNIENLTLIAQKDPKMFQQLMALTAVSDNEISAE